MTFTPTIDVFISKKQVTKFIDYMIAFHTFCVLDTRSDVKSCGVSTKRSNDDGAFRPHLSRNITLTHFIAQ